MSDKPSKFDPNKIFITDYKLMKGQVDAPEGFDPKKIEGFNVDNALDLGFNIDDGLVKAEYTVKISTESKGRNKEESSGNFHLVFIYSVENMNELAKVDSKNIIMVNPELANAMSAVTYSTVRGVLLTRLQGTSLHNFVLPIINPNTLIENNLLKK